MSKSTWKADKGLLNGSCNREACQRPGANFYNHSTMKHYCRYCAIEINRANPPNSDSFVTSLGHDLCTEVKVADPFELHWVEVRASDVMEFFAKAYEFKNGEKLVDYRWFYDPNKATVVFKLTTEKAS